jgi:hypothetical protein
MSGLAAHITMRMLMIAGISLFFYFAFRPSSTCSSTLGFSGRFCRERATEQKRKQIKVMPRAN